MPAMRGKICRATALQLRVGEIRPDLGIGAQFFHCKCRSTVLQFHQHPMHRRCGHVVAQGLSRKHESNLA